MGLLKSLLPVAGAALGSLVGMPQVGAAAGTALGGALSKSGASSKATAAQLAAIEDAKKRINQSYEDVKGYQNPAYSTLQPGINALTSRLGLPTATTAPRNALTAPGGYAPPGPQAGASDTFDPKAPGSRGEIIGYGPTDKPIYANDQRAARDAARTDGGGSGVIDMAPQPDGSYAMNPGTYGGGVNPTAPKPYEMPASYEGPQAPGAFHYNLDDYTNSPVYRRLLDKGQQSILASSGATGALHSGAALKALEDRAIGDTYDYIDRERGFEYGKYRDEMGDYRDQRDFGYRRATDDRGFGYGLTRDARSDYQDDRNYLTNRFDTGTDNLFRYTGIGQGAANALTGAATRYGDTIAGLITDGGDVRATNALTQGGVGSDLTGDIGGLIAGLFTPGGGGSSSGSVYGNLPWVKGP